MPLNLSSLIFSIDKKRNKCHFKNVKQPSFQEVLGFLLEAASGTAAFPLRAFDEVFPQIAEFDQFYLELSDDSISHLNGRYRVIDLYCQAPTCNCHKVSLMFIDKHQKVWATVSYGWKSKTFYRKWGLDNNDAQALANGFLDPLEEQSENAPLFLQGFLLTLKNNREFIARLKQRYSLFKEIMASDPSLIKIYSEKKLPDNVIPFKSPKRQ